MNDHSTDTNQIQLSERGYFWTGFAAGLVCGGFLLALLNWIF